jgi:excinuclease UvrABC nuclease subunit
MPFSYGPYDFSDTGINCIKDVGGVYGLAQRQILTNSYVILYVGKTDSLPTRLRAHLNNPPAAGITHFFAETHSTDAARTQREYQLIQEYMPLANTQLK